MKTKKGFTLIELLIVIAIIGILAVALVPAITGGPARARDAQRKTMASNIVTAVEAWAVDHSGSYPKNDDSFCLTAGVGLSSDYLRQGTPTDPSPDNAANPCEEPDDSDPATTEEDGLYYYRKLTKGYLVAVSLEHGASNSSYTVADIVSTTTPPDIDALITALGLGTPPITDDDRLFIMANRSD